MGGRRARRSHEESESGVLWGGGACTECGGQGTRAGCEVPVCPPGEGGHRQLTAVSFERISAGDRGVGGQPTRCDGSLGRKEIFQSQGKCRVRRRFKDK